MEVGSDYLFTRQTICFNFSLTARYSHPFPINRSGLALCCGLSVWWWKTGRRVTTNCISADLRYSCLWLNRWTHLLIHRQTCEFCTARWSLWLHCVATLGLSAVRVRVPFCLVHTRYSLFFSHVTLNQVTKKIVQSCFFHTTQGCPCISFSPRLDFCEALHTGITQASLHRLQLGQNAAARIITYCRSYNPNPALPALASSSSLRWL